MAGKPGCATRSSQTSRPATMSLKSRWAMVRTSGAIAPPPFAFTVRPAFHQTAGFYLLIALLIIASIALYVRQRTWSLRQRQQELIALVDERTREIRAGEAHLAESNKTLRQLNQEKKPVSRYRRP